MVVESFDILISKSYGYDSVKQANSPAWAMVKSLFENNFMPEPTGVHKIPKKIHQIWLGGRLPEKYVRLTKTWQEFHPTWEYRLWTDRDADRIQMSKRNIFDACVNKGMKSDILRYEILSQQGGLYVDTDFECLRAFDDFMYLDFFAGISYDGDMVLYNGLIATIPHHPIIELCSDALNKKYAGKCAMTIMNATGPYHFTRCFLARVTKDTKGVIAFPMGFFYPIPNYVMDEVNLSDYLYPYSYAVHYWNISWLKGQ